MSKAQAQLLAITPKVPDYTVALMIADVMTESEREPYCFSINHSVGPPDRKACPLPYDWAYKKTVGITKKSRAEAEKWLVHALMKGYTVERVSPKDHLPDGGSCYSIATARRRAYICDIDDEDDIPF